MKLLHICRRCRLIETLIEVSKRPRRSCVITYDTSISTIADAVSCMPVATRPRVSFASSQMPQYLTGCIAHHCDLHCVLYCCVQAECVSCSFILLKVATGTLDDTSTSSDGDGERLDIGSTHPAETDFSNPLKPSRFRECSD